MHFVEYEVDGFDGVQRAGPYTATEIESQRDDIAGYEGVKNVRIVTQDPGDLL